MVLTREQRKFVIKELQKTSKTYRAIADDVGCHLTTIRKIDLGQVNYVFDYYDGSFPIRKPNIKKLDTAMSQLNRLLEKNNVELEELVEEYEKLYKK
jgi:hypothetical protein